MCEKWFQFDSFIFIFYTQVYNRKIYRSSLIYLPILMGVMVLFQLLFFLQNACFRVRMAPGPGHMCHIDNIFSLLLFQRK